MRRTGIARGSSQLRRLTPLRSGTMPRTPQEPAGGTGGAVPVPRGGFGVRKPSGADEKAARKLVLRRSEGRCEMGCGMFGDDWSHRRAAGQGGAWRGANGLRACRRCHTACELAPILADLGGWRIVHRNPDPATAPVYLKAFDAREAGWYLLDDVGGMEPAPWSPPPTWFPWMPRPR